MEFVQGSTYENASGRFRVVSISATTMKLEYSTGPQVGRVLSKRVADMTRLPTREALVSATALVPPQGAPKQRRRTAAN